MKLKEENIILLIKNYYQKSMLEKFGIYNTLFVLYHLNLTI